MSLKHTFIVTVEEMWEPNYGGDCIVEEWWTDKSQTTKHRPHDLPSTIAYDVKSKRPLYMSWTDDRGFPDIRPNYEPDTIRMDEQQPHMKWHNGWNRAYIAFPTDIYRCSKTGHVNQFIYDDPAIKVDETAPLPAPKVPRLIIPRQLCPVGGFSKLWKRSPIPEP